MEKIANEGKTNAVIAYLTIIGTLVAHFLNSEKRNSFSSFHIRQALGIHIVFHLLGIVVSGFNSWYITLSLYFFIMVPLVYGIISASKGERNLVPVLGVQFQKWFKKKD